MKEVVVSVVIITFNHQNYIEEAINSVLSQDCSFNFEIILANDCSTDQTHDIIQSVLKSNPRSSCIKYIEHKKNIGITPNFVFALRKSKGKYIAVCEGDDYWTDNLKLQKQVDFLENNIDYNLVGHYAMSSQEKVLGKFKNDTFEFKDIYQKNLRIPTASLVFRNNISYPDWIFDIYGGDRAVIFLNAQKGKLKILPFLGSFYRVHEGGAEFNSKKDKFNLAIRNIKEEFVYYSLLKHENDVSIIKNRIYKNHFYILALGIKKIQPAKFLKAFISLVNFNFFDKIKY